jgi:hypothetical protein
MNMQRKEALTTDERSSTEERLRPDRGLSTRDLASPSDRTTDGGEAGPDAPEAVSSAQTGAAATSSTSTATDPGAQVPTQVDTVEHDDALRRGDSPRPVDAARRDAAEQPGEAPTADATPADTSPSGDTAGSDAPLVPSDMSATLRRRWEVIQTRFVDEPRGAVEDADGLVATLMQQLAEGFAKERERLEAQWDRGEDISTEDLRVALQRYRSFFQRLLST